MEMSNGTPAKTPAKGTDERRCSLDSCRRLVPRLSEAFRCSFCFRYWHEACAAAPSNEWDHIRKAKSCLWPCAECKAKINKNRRAFDLTTLDGIVESRVKAIQEELEICQLENSKVTSNYNKLLGDYQDLKRQMELQADNSIFTLEKEKLEGKIVDLNDIIAVKNNEISKLKETQIKNKERIRDLNTIGLENENLKTKIDEMEEKYEKLKSSKPDADQSAVIAKHDEFRVRVVEVLNKGLKQVDTSVMAVGDAIAKMNTVQNDASKAIHDSIRSLEKLVKQQATYVHTNVKQPTNTPRIVRAAQTSNQNSEIAQLTFAQALAQSPTQPDAVRTVQLLGDDVATAQISAQLRADDSLSEFPILSVKQRGRKNFVLKCQDASTALKVETVLNNKYGTQIKISQTTPKLPQIKIIRLPIDITEKDEIEGQLRRQNGILREAEFKIVENYIVNSPRGTYQNVIIECDLNLHTKILEKRTMMFKFGEVRCFEHIAMLQCSKCLALGHLARECRRPVHCRRCAQEHATSACDSPDEISCVNCIRANANGAKYGTNHRPTDDRCPLRKQRTEALKIFLSKNDN